MTYWSRARLSCIAALVAAMCLSFACAGLSRPSGTAGERTSAGAEAGRPEVARTFRGYATFYGKGFAGRKTASGERFDPAAMVAAHRTLPFGTKVRVTNLANGRSVVLRIIDRGPFSGRATIIDVSAGAAKRLGFFEAGRARVTVEVLMDDER